MVSGFVGWAVWKVSSLFKEGRHDMRAHVAQALTIVAETVEEHGRRLQAVEVFNAGLTAMLKSIEEFRADVKQRFEYLHGERKDDMREIYNRLDTIIKRGESDGRSRE